MGVEDDVRGLIAASRASTVAVGYCSVPSKEGFFILPEEPFHAASTMKVGVLVELFHQAALGELELDEPIVLRNQFHSIVDGSTYSIDIEDDSEKILHTRLGECETLLALAKPMIVDSSNLATNLLVERLGAEKISHYMKETGAAGLQILRGVEDGKAYRLGLNNTATARSLTHLMWGIAHREVVSPSASDKMIEILLAQTHRDSIPAGLPPDVPVANKMGWNTGICHDSGIVFPKNRSAYVLTVLTRGLDTRAEGSALIAEISRRIWDHQESSGAR